jgi:DNA-binding MarR family transcriptional regulator
MSKKEKFIKFVQDIIDEKDLEKLDKDSLEAIEFFNIFKTEGAVVKKKFTENGKKILQYLQENYEINNNLFKAKDIGAGLGISSKVASGSMRKLVTDNYLEKISENPNIYSLTDLGKNVDLSEE